MDPSVHTIEREYFYKFDIRDFFILNNSIKIITPLLFSTDPVTYSDIFLPIPAWLKFDQQTQTFTGRPTKVEYPNVAQFPIVLKIVLNVTDTELLNATSYAATLKITNFNPHYKYEVG